MGITLACVPNHITIIPMLTLKISSGVQELLHSSYQKHMYHLQMHKKPSKKGVHDTDFFQPIPITHDYLLPMADTDKTTDNFTFFNKF